MKREPSQNPPFGLEPKQVRQLVSFTFDDNTYSGIPGSGAEGGMKYVLDLFGRYRNHDGSPILGTFFLKADNIDGNELEDDSFVKRIWHRAKEEGHELAMHTYSHPHGLDIDWDAEPATRTPIMSTDDWLAEHEKCYATLEKPYDPEMKGSGIGLKRSEIVGFRTPFLEYNDNVFTSLERLGLLYEAAIEEGWQDSCDGSNELWPYTLDEGSPGETFVAENMYSSAPLIGKHPGLWALPMYVYIAPPDDRCREYGTEPGLRDRLAAENKYFDIQSGKVTGMDWNVWFEYFMSENDAFATFAYTYDLHYNGNRCPFFVGLHSDIYSDKYEMYDLEGAEASRLKASAEQRRNMLRRLLEHILSRSDSTVLTAKEVVRYLSDSELLKK
ncbi:MAG: polysaccharide deacetylase family protein [Spirochaetales bacterium]|nr:polysaccharide deacetylase family protein [Spirochaetales bacterium]